MDFFPEKGELGDRFVTGKNSDGFVLIGIGKDNALIARMELPAEIAADIAMSILDTCSKKFEDIQKDTKPIDSFKKLTDKVQ